MSAQGVGPSSAGYGVLRGGAEGPALGLGLPRSLPSPLRVWLAGGTPPPSGSAGSASGLVPDVPCLSLPPPEARLRPGCQASPVLGPAHAVHLFS